MSARAGTGITIDVARVPQREHGMTPYEILLSESQERMLLVVKKGREREVEDIFEKWDLHAVCIGTVTGDGRVRVTQGGALVADVPAKALADDAPLYDRPARRPAWQDEVERLETSMLRPEPSPADAFTQLLVSPNIASKQWIYRQYDHMVRTNTVVMPEAGTPVVRIKGGNKGLALSVDGNGRRCYLDPRRGAMLAVAEAARNVACAGAEPVGATNNLNFGNPERPEIMWQLIEAIEGMAEACRAFELPITGGNVSLYNETDGRAIYPTPVIGVVGLLEDVRRAIGRSFPAGDLDILILGDNRGDLAGSEYLKIVLGLVRGRPAAPDFALERALQRFLPRAAGLGLIRSANDVSEGGLAVALAEACFGCGVGADVEVAPATASVGSGVAAALFGESPGVVVVSVRPEQRRQVQELAAAHGIAVHAAGRTGGSALRIRVSGTAVVDERIEDVRASWASALGDLMRARTSIPKS
jgi:phosphoribosylformylglycinamidine synthase